jgi:glucose-1-phosphate adenylyltransferase
MHALSDQLHYDKPASLDMKKVAAIILGGGKGTRLFPLTQSRCKPAMSLGGRHRLIDVPISNSINSGCHKIFVITQFLSASLHRHIFQTYRYDIFPAGYLELLTAEQKPTQNDWFLGTADAVRQNLEYFIDIPVDYFLILSGDQLYKMNFLNMLRFAYQTDADLVIAAMPIAFQDIARMGIMKINNDHFVENFNEKPQTPSDLPEFLHSNRTNKPYMGSMGIYLFKREALCKLLSKDSREDFGRHLIPTQIKWGKTAAYVHENYWEDIGTVESFYNANIELTHTNPAFDFYDETWPIYSNRHHLQGPKILNTHLQQSIICEGSVIGAKDISHSILGPRSIVHKGCSIQHSYILGNDFYQPSTHANHLPKELSIGENCIIHRAILDKHVQLGKNVQLINKNKLQNYNGNNIFIRDGIIIVPQGVSLPDGFIL